MDIVTETIKSYFDSEEWKYELKSEEDNSIHSFYIGFSGRNEELFFRINVFPEDKVCQIACQSETKIRPEYMSGASRAINEFNLHSRLVCGCVGKNGNITFWIGRNTDGDTFSKEAIAADFDIVFRVTDNETAQILKRAIQLTTSDSSNRRNGIFSLFKK